MSRLIIFIILVLALDFYALQSFRSVIKSSFVTYGYVIISIIIFSNIVYQGMTFDRSSVNNQGFYLALALFILVYVPKLVLLILVGFCLLNLANKKQLDRLDPTFHMVPYVVDLEELKLEFSQMLFVDLCEPYLWISF